MTNEVVTFGKRPNLPSNLEAFAKGVQTKVADLSQSAVGQTPFIKLDKAGGGWMYGQDDTEVEEGSKWAFNPLSLEHGWIAWGDSEVLGERMVPISQPKPDPAELPNVGVKWDEQISIQLKCVSGEDAGVEALYKGTSVGMKQAMHDYVTQLSERINNGETALVGVTTLAYSDYKHKKWGRIFKPEFDFTEWLTLEGKPAEEGEDASAESASEPVTEAETVTTTAKDTPENGADNEDGTVRRRRRRRRNA